MKMYKIGDYVSGVSDYVYGSALSKSCAAKIIGVNERRHTYKILYPNGRTVEVFQHILHYTKIELDPIQKLLWFGDEDL